MSAAVNDAAGTGAIRSTVASDRGDVGGGKGRLDVSEPRGHEGCEVIRIGVTNGIEIGVHRTRAEVAF